MRWAPGQTAFEPLLKALMKESLATKHGSLSYIQVKALIKEYQDSVMTAARAEVDEEWHRWFLWEACPHELKYGDDGEMQCGGADFRRDELWTLQRHVQEALGEKHNDLMELRRERIDLSVRLADAEITTAKAGKRIEELEDALSDIYTGELGFKNPHHPHIIQAGIISGRREGK